MENTKKSPHTTWNPKIGLSAILLWHTKQSQQSFLSIKGLKICQRNISQTQIKKYIWTPSDKSKKWKGRKAEKEKNSIRQKNPDKYCNQ